MILHRGRQWPVGHGGFFTGEISCEPPGDWPPFRYVYDCGALTRNGLDPAIDTYLNDVASTTGVIDLVVVSHVDEDHVKGLKRLIAGPVPVRRVMMPLLSPTDRLIALARSAETNDGEGRPDGGGPGGGGDDTFGAEFALFPEEVLASYGVEVVFVSGDDDGGEPLGPDPVVDDGDPWAPDEEFEVDETYGRGERDEWDRHTPGAKHDHWGDERAEPWNPLSPGMHRSRYDDMPWQTGSPSDLDPDRSRYGGREGAPPGMRMAGFGPVRASRSGRSVTMSHRNGLVLRERTRGATWLLAPYVAPRVTAQRDRFIAALAGAGRRIEDFEGPLDEYSLRRIVDDMGALRQAYRAAGGTNAGSLSLYSGPLPRDTASAFIEIGDPWTPERAMRYPVAAPGTLMTGDSELARRGAVGDLLHHYGGYADSVGILHLPHHGSSDNFRSQLLRAFPRLRFALAMTPTRDPRGNHPSRAVIDDVLAANVLPHQVTTDAVSTVVTLASVG